MISIEQMEPMCVDPEKYFVNQHGSINPFQQDAVRMGYQLGTNCTVMFSNFENDHCLGFVVVNTQTGERVWVNMDVLEKVKYEN